jgi:bacterioferritin
VRELGLRAANVPEQLRLDLHLERVPVTRLIGGIERCRSLADNGSRDLVEEILKSEEGHIDWIEAQLELIRQVGDAQYRARQIRENEA